MRARSRVPFLALIACGSSPKPAPAPAVPVENVTRTCTEAAVGIEGATKGIRPPESPSLVQPMRGACRDDRWSAEAIECFATMHEGDLGRCATKLPDEARKAMFAALGDSDETAIALARVRLDGMHVGVPECDHLFAIVKDLMTCDRIPPNTRAQLGNSAVNLWDLPPRLPADAAARMAVVCGQTLDEIRRRLNGTGCAP